MVISLGLVLQKWGVGWFSEKNKNHDDYHSWRRVWILGFALNNCLSVFYYFALKGLTPSVVGATMGLNIVFSAIFSALINKEHLSKTLIVLSLFLIGFIGMANLSAPPYENPQAPDVTIILVFFAIPFFVVGGAFLLRRFFRVPDELYAIVFAGAAGSLEGFIIILIKAMQAAKGSNPLDYFLTPYLYMYLIASSSLIGFLQVSHTYGRITRTGPVLWGAQILYPVCLSYIVFSVQLVPMQVVAFSGIIACVLLIQAKRT